MPRDTIADPQAGDCFLCTLPCGKMAVHVVHRRAQWVWFASGNIPIRSSRIDHFAQTLLMAKAVPMDDLTELERWPEPKDDPNQPSPPEA